jgi:hypothetical protein
MKIEKKWKTGLIWGGLVCASLTGISIGQQLPNGDGKQLVEDTCARSCHGSESWSELRLDKEDWDPLVRDMSGRGEAKTEAELTKMIAYLAKYFGPEKAPEKGAEKAPESAPKNAP